MSAKIIYDSPAGKLGLIEKDGALIAVCFERELPSYAAVEMRETPLLQETKRQLERYFTGGLQEFDLPLTLEGTPFQQKVWKSLCKVPYGQTTSYGEIAKDVGNPRGARAVGMANHRNPICIIIPCHRIIGTNGRLVGYGGGLEIKVKLLKLEGCTGWKE